MSTMDGSKYFEGRSHAKKVYFIIYMNGKEIPRNNAFF
jgi:hypothetical protein